MHTVQLIARPALLVGVMSEITFSAAVYKVSTLADGGIRITLDLPETAIATAAMLMETKQQGIPLLFTAKADDGLDVRQTRK
jgi:hypothetical protein